MKRLVSTGFLRGGMVGRRGLFWAIDSASSSSEDPSGCRGVTEVKHFLGNRADLGDSGSCTARILDLSVLLDFSGADSALSDGLGSLKAAHHVAGVRMDQGKRLVQA